MKNETIILKKVSESQYLSGLEETVSIYESDNGYTFVITTEKGGKVDHKVYVRKTVK